MFNLLTVYASSSPIIEQNDNMWSPTIDGMSQKSWFTLLSSSVSVLN